MHKFSFLTYILLLLALQAKAVVLPPYSDFNHMQSPKHEVRAVWLTTIGGLDWPHSYAQSKNSIAKQQAELCTLLDQYAKAGINTVLIQTRIRGTVIYPSAYEPWDGCLSGFPGTSPGYDALKFAIDECHKRGMELHAWVVTLPMGKWNKLGCRKLHAKYPGLIKKIGPDGYMDPENPRTATYLADICEEITRNYDVDGIHLDYIRYPETWKMRVSASRGRQNITSIVRNIHDKVKRLKPWVKMSCSPIGKFDDLSRYWSHGWNAYTKVCQDAQGWLRDGLMDELFPMMYFRNDQFFPFAIDWAEQSHGKIVAPGLGIYFLDPKEGKWNVADVTREMEVSSHVSPIAALPFVRQALVRQQQEMGKEKGIVMDGRDIGTVVFPDAELKIFVTASAEVRAQRRYDELKQKGMAADFNEILKNVEERDYIDTHRETSPLKQADDALVLDNSNMTIPEQKEWLKQKFEETMEKLG